MTTHARWLRLLTTATGLLALLAAGPAVTGCGDSDAGSDTDADTGRVDVVADTSSDAGPTDALADTADAGPDTGGDTVADAGPDTTPDTADAGPDAVDARDVAIDTGPDTVFIPPRCGDGTTDFNEECDDGDDANSDTTPNACRTSCKNPRCGDGVTDAGDLCDDGNTNDFDGCTAACKFSDVVATPTAGDLVISELMVNPDAAPDPAGEWFELTNTSGAPLNLFDCVISDDGTDTFAVDGLLVGIAGQVVFAFEGDPTANGGVTADFVYGTMLLDNGADELIVRCGGVEIDRVAYNATTWPLISGRTLNLDPTRNDAVSNDDVGSWCSGLQPYGAGDLGSPGALNPQCFQLDTTVDFCQLTTPATLEAYTDFPALVTVDVREFGVTDLTDGVDISPLLTVEIGSGPSGADPAVDTGWTWAAAAPIPGWTAPDERDGYQGALVFPTVSEHLAAARVSRDAGATWTICDRTGSDDGFLAADITTISVLTSPCEGTSCLTPPPPACEPDAVSLVMWDPAGLCVPESVSAFGCEYSPAVIDCGASGQVCEVDACGATAPAPAAEGDLLISEIMLTPSAIAPADGQWIEVENTSGGPLNMAGCTLLLTLPATEEGGADTELPHVIGAPVVLPTDTFAVLGPNGDLGANGGAPVRYAFGADNALPEDAFSWSISCGGVVIDTLTYDPAAWPSAAGAAIQLSPFHRTVADNDLPDSWCLATLSYGEGDRGTPGAANQNCPGDIVDIDACWLPDSAALTLPAGTQSDIAVRIIEPGITTLNVRTNPNDKLIVEVGYGPVGSTPDDAAWTWFVAAADLDWIASPSLGFDIKEDQYLGVFKLPAPGSYDVAVRATADGGNSFRLCSTDADATDYDPAAALGLVTEASACDPDPCGVAPGLVCEALDDDAVGPATVVLDQQTPSICALDDDGLAVCGWVTTVIEDCAELGAECTAGACANFPVPAQPGDVVISELRIIPPNALGEWMELTNPHPYPVDLTGCTIGSGPDESWLIALNDPLDHVIAPGAAMVVARSLSSSLNGGAQPRGVYTDLSFANNADWVDVRCGGVLIDLIAWSVEDDWTIPVNVPMALSGNQTSAAANDFPGAWCVPPSQSPNAANPVCPAPDTVIDDCRVATATLSTPADDAASVEGVLFDAGVTDVRPGIDAAIGTLGQVGFGPVGSTPLGDAAWTWVEASPDVDWVDAEMPGYDRWIGRLTPADPGDFDMAWRFSPDDGATWTYCDVGGSADGYQVADSGKLAVAPTTCKPNPCTTPDPPTCIGTSSVVLVGPGTCSEDAETGEAVCDYGGMPFNCAAFGGCDDATGLCASPPPTPATAGAVVITEIMRDSTLPPPDAGEYIELFNPGTEALDLRGCTLSDLDGDGFTFERIVPIVFAAGQYFLVAGPGGPSATGNLNGVDYVWSNFVLDNVADEVVLTCGAVEIDAVAYSFGWPSEVGRSMQLDSGSLDATINDDAAAWCTSTSAYGAGNRGTPGTANKVCP